MKVSFQILTGRHQGKFLNLPADRVVIGRDPKAQIRVNSTEVSREHCEVTVRDQTVFVKDLGSRNGTFVNGEAIFGEVSLLPGDSLHVGNMVFELAGKKKGASPAKGGKKKKAPGSKAAVKTASDEDVIDWLAEDGGEFDDQDTTIISNASLNEGKGENEHSDDDSSDAVLVPRTSSMNIKPIESGTAAEEAAEVIREFWKKQN